MVFLKLDKKLNLQTVSVQTRADMGVCVWLREEGNVWVGVQIISVLTYFVQVGATKKPRTHFIKNIE